MEMPILTSDLGIAMHGDSKGRSLEFGIPWPFLTFLWADLSKWAMEFRIPNFRPWNRHGNSMSSISESASPWTEV